MINNKEVKGNTIIKFGMFLQKYSTIIACFMVLLVMASGTVFATGGGTGGTTAGGADTMWVLITNLIKTWVTRLGGVVMFIGGVMFGMGWKSDDAEQKSRGVSTIVAGAIVVAVAAITGTFFA